MEVTKKTPASRVRPGKRTPAPSVTRTNRDWVMIFLGIFLIVFFIAAAYVSIIKTNKNAPFRKRGPVKNPKKLGSVDRKTAIYKTNKAKKLSLRLLDRRIVEEKSDKLLIPGRAHGLR